MEVDGVMSFWRENWEYVIVHSFKGMRSRAQRHFIISWLWWTLNIKKWSLSLWTSVASEALLDRYGQMIFVLLSKSKESK